ncbi:retropepsin-like aspartic protease, partial [Aeromonas sobria]|uniref:retropepsin-like aspartic protease n=1 Tax=Aeromonas sobria TaxID=646 RepID=UPI003F38F121
MTKIDHREQTIAPKLLVKALVDTGCSKTSISKKCFDMLNVKMDQNLPLNTDINISIQAATDKSCDTAFGMTTLNLIFDEKSHFFMTVTLMIVEGLCEPLILGQDFLGSFHVNNISKTHITFNTVENSHIKVPLHVET